MRVIDSHTAGEPTRVIVSGGPALGRGSLAQQAARLQAEHRDFCAGVLREPRGREALVGALLTPAPQPDCVAGVIFFNLLQNLGMCGHATIGLAVTLAHLGVIAPGVHRIATPVGIVTVTLHDSHTASVVNVESYRHLKDVVVRVEGVGDVVGDVAWGGNWFFLVKQSPIAIKGENIRALGDAALAVREALQRDGITGRDGAWIDHVEFFGPPDAPGAHSKNFVLCPDGAYDRSPCGTGCSAKIACLAADGDWPAGAEWTQESIIGSTYRISYQAGAVGGIAPTITGAAFITAEADLIFDPADPYRHGVQL